MVGVSSTFLLLFKISHPTKRQKRKINLKMNMYAVSGIQIKTPAPIIGPSKTNLTHVFFSQSSPSFSLAIDRICGTNLFTKKPIAPIPAIHAPPIVSIMLHTSSFFCLREICFKPISNHLSKIIKKLFQMRPYSITYP